MAIKTARKKASMKEKKRAKKWEGREGKEEVEEEGNKHRKKES